MLKKIIPLLLAVALIFGLVGCFNRENTAQNAELKTEFAATAQITYQDMTAKAEISKSGGTYQMKLLEPETLSGMKFDYDGEKVTVSYMGLSLNVDKSTAVSAMASAIIYSMDNALLGSNTSVANEGENYVVNGKTESGNYKLTVNRATGIPVALELPDLKFSCAFEQVKK